MTEIALNEIIKAVDGELVQGDPSLIITGISIDSRSTNPGELFIALPGERFDGHHFLDQAFERGATAVLIMKAMDVPVGRGSVIRVPDTLKALGMLARFHRRKFDIPVIGITGSNGKTTTKDLVAAVLSQQWPIVYTAGNFNNEIGLPLTLFKISSAAKAAVVEMGMRGLGQIRELAKIAEPNIGIVTNVGLSHLELLGSQENIARAKSELIEALPPDGLAILNGDDPWVRKMKDHCPGRSILFGMEGSNLDYRAGDLQTGPQGSEFTVYFQGGCCQVQIPIPGRHNVLNALAAFAVGREFGMNPEPIKKGLAQSQLTEKRLHIVKRYGFSIIDDTYNASPSSVKAALETLLTMGAGNRKIAVLADMLELGPTSNQIHREIGEYAAQIGIDLLLTFGELAHDYNAGFDSRSPGKSEHFSQKSALITHLKSILQPGDLILIKGSRGMKMEEVVAALSEMEVGICGQPD
ncbi:UDP-N-acetylmuramoyl-tripeptide--D-alanyl-D-alanine ligase [Hydrogenispora ethanolica]|uniref:UDP-N-acetylmuramoyl-tripeptide--D-alanyl-D-alanine ligase n=1 Tax=Hydrogenispora ethanolica TaxID=1082276 RepID=A0A4R1QZ69_HYDET|nr:UDP-N-acetylmuramoyl-tripeptide--D-alanyl-D-alanine ligase [Hydrogenispora ethanolica]TCL58276.1 UDP-N-acetylmuramoyl-tripeptide--D-alanyl-D-alanine ligase [Hydrogenispora ethanolica]